MTATPEPDVLVVGRGRGDRGGLDDPVGILFGTVAIMLFVLILIETVAFWHAHNVFEAAAAEGARVAAAFDGTCTTGTATARASITRRAGGWAAGVTITCREATGEVTITIDGRTPGVVSTLGPHAHVTESAPRER